MLLVECYFGLLYANDALRCHIVYLGFDPRSPFLLCCYFALVGHLCNLSVAALPYYILNLFTHTRFQIHGISCAFCIQRVFVLFECDRWHVLLHNHVDRLFDTVCLYRYRCPAFSFRRNFSFLDRCSLSVTALPFDILLPANNLIINSVGLCSARRCQIYSPLWQRDCCVCHLYDTGI